MNSWHLSFNKENSNLLFCLECSQERLRFVFQILITDQEMRYIPVLELNLVKYYGRRLFFNTRDIDTEHGIDINLLERKPVTIMLNQQVFHLISN